MGWVADLLKEIPSAARYKSELEQLLSEHSILKQENTTLKQENAALKEEVAELKKRLDPITNIDETTMNILNLLFTKDELSLNGIASSLKITNSFAKYHRDILLEADLIQQADPSIFGDTETFEISPKGREYVVKTS